MFQKIKMIKFLIAVCAMIFPLAVNVFAQSQWLDMKPLPSWNERKRAILQTKKISADELKRCAVVIRQPSLPQDFQLTKMGWTLTGGAQIYGKTAVITAAEAFDGMCRPLKFDTYVFVGNRVAGTLSPGQMDSRTDGYLTNVQLTGEKNLTAEYARYRETDALCCPYKTENVTFSIKPDGKNFLLVPDGKFESSVGGGGEKMSANSTGDLKNVVWQWTGLQANDEKVATPEKYTVKFTDDGKLQVLADCNRGGGSYTISGNDLKISGIFTTKMACPPDSSDNKFLRGLESAQSYKIEGETLSIKISGGTMTFSRASSGAKSPLENTVWRWQSANDAKDEITVDKPEKYELRFGANGELGVTADCNVGGGNYKTTADKLSISSIISTQAFCGEGSLDKRFINGLQSAETFSIEGNFLTIEANGETLRFFRVYKQD